MPYSQRSYDSDDGESYAATEELPPRSESRGAGGYPRPLPAEAYTPQQRFQTPPDYGRSRASWQWLTGPPGTGHQTSQDHQTLVHSSMLRPTYGTQVTGPGPRHGPPTSGYYPNSIPAQPFRFSDPLRLANELAEVATNYRPAANAPTVNTTFHFGVDGAWVDTHTVARSRDSTYPGKKRTSLHRVKLSEGVWHRTPSLRMRIESLPFAHTHHASRCRIESGRSFHTAVRDESRGVGRSAAAAANGLREQRQ
jgi:hypothetical protein